MAVTRSKKEEVVDDLATTLQGAKSVVFANYRGLTVKEMEDLRKAMREQGATMKVAKLTLMRRVFADLKLPAELDFSAPTAVAYSSEDEIAPAKIFAKFATDTKKLEILAGILGNEMVDANGIKDLAKLPGKQELRGQVVSVLAGPMRGFVGVLAATERSFLYALTAIAEKKQAA
jgi:large subunit ribosomal protein L10